MNQIDLTRLKKKKMKKIPLPLFRKDSTYIESIINIQLNFLLLILLHFLVAKNHKKIKSCLELMI